MDHVSFLDIAAVLYLASNLAPCGFDVWPVNFAEYELELVRV